MHRRLAGLIKVALALHHKVLPPTGGIRKPNPKVRFDESPFYIRMPSLRPWIHGTQKEPRRAGVSAFGFGGTNFHAIARGVPGRIPARDGCGSTRSFSNGTRRVQRKRF